MADTADEVHASSTEDEEPKQEEAKDEEAPSITELLVQLGRDVSVLVFLESQLAASRNLPEVRRMARDLAGTLIVVLAALTAFAFANVAALNALEHVMSTSLAALAICAVWLVIGAVATLALMIRAGHVTGWRWWRVFRAGPEESLEDLERARARAEQAVHDTLGRLAPVMTVEIASASVAVAGDVAGDVIEAGGDILESADEAVEALAEDLPAGSVVNQVWGIFLMPGRVGVKVATTVLRRGSNNQTPSGGASPS
ncbi:MAG: hypothetical protein JO363_14175 [Solirubrobacterales bacterium]|nr:hypothetical protein [Solirubrobacterales bacterium]